MPDQSTLKKTIIFLTLFLGLWLFANHALAATYYVDYESGNDNSSGLSQSAPWKRSPGMSGVTGIAAATSLQPGVTVYFKKGIVWPASTLPLTISRNGTSGNPITFSVTNWGTGIYAIFDAEHTGTQAIYSYGYSYFTIDGI